MTWLKLRADRLQWVELEGEVVALDESALMYLGANESAALLWRELAAGTTRERLGELLARQFGLDPAEAEADVDSFLDDLRARGLIESE
jgi:hypothetical protein